MDQNNNNGLNTRDAYFGLLIPKTEPAYNPLTPVSFIDSSTGRTENPNTERPTLSSAPTSESLIGSSDPMSTELLIGSSDESLRSYLEGLSFTENDTLSISSSGLMNGTDPLSNPFEPITAEEMNRASDSFGLANHFQWSPPVDLGSGSSSGAATTDSSPDTNWLSNMDGHVTSLTDLLDPIFVNYDQDLTTTTETKLEYYSSDSDGVNTNNLMVSSDLISSTYQNDQSNVLGLESDLSAQLGWSRQDSPDSQFMFCEPSTSAESSMLLRTALQGGSGTRNLFELQPNPNLTNNPACDMELRRVLSYPPIMAPMSTTSNSSLSPSSTSGGSPTSGGEIYYQVHPHNNPNQYYEFRFVDPMFNQGADIPLSVVQPQQQPQASMPNVEELMRRMDYSQPDPGTATFYNGNQTQQRKVDMNSDRKVNSTTHSSKWSYATPSSSSGPGGPTKPIKRRKRQPKPERPSSSTWDRNQGDNSQLPGTSSGQSCPYPRSGHGGGGNSSSGSRKERSLHHCNVCNKGFKDRYSVNVHIRTHSGEKPFACTLCGKHFRQKAHLAKHYQTHAKNGKGKKGAPEEEKPEDKDKNKMDME